MSIFERVSLGLVLIGVFFAVLGGAVVLFSFGYKLWIGEL